MEESMRKVFQGDGNEVISGKEMHFNVYYDPKSAQIYVRVTNSNGYPVESFAHGMSAPLEGMVTISKGGVVSIYEEYFGTSVKLSVPMGKILVDLPEFGARPMSNQIVGYGKDYQTGNRISFSAETIKVYGKIANVLDDKGISTYTYFF